MPSSLLCRHSCRLVKSILLPLTHFYSAIAGKPYSWRAGGFPASRAGCVTHEGLGLRRLSLCGLEETRSLNNDPRRENRMKAHLLELGYPPTCSTRPPVLQLITGLGSKMGQMSTPRGPAWEQGLPGQSRGCHCQHISLSLRQGHLHV